MAAPIDALVISRVIGDVIDVFVPSVNMSVSYGSKDVTNGCEITPFMAFDPPKVLISSNSDELFTLVMTDPDAPNPGEPTMREVVHWIVVNIPGGTDPTHGEEIVKYVNPMPVLGIHRFVFVLFKQKGVVNGVEKPESYYNFSTRTFANNLDLGLPVASVYFNAPSPRMSRRNQPTS